jgi:hypothetical protein
MKYAGVEFMSRVAVAIHDDVDMHGSWLR